MFGRSYFVILESKAPDTHLVLLLLYPAVAVVTLRVGFHGHGGEEVLHGVVAEIMTDSPKLQQIPENKNVT